MRRVGSERLIAIAAAFSIALSAPAGAYQVRPMTASIQPSGPKAMHRLVVRNDEAAPITVEFQTFAVDADQDGKRILKPEDQDLAVFPPQAVIRPGAEQMVQIRYVGDPAIQQARIYGVRVAQLPVDFKPAGDVGGAKAALKIAFNFMTYIYVTPKDAKPSLKVSELKRDAKGDLTFVVENGGPGVAVLRDARFAFSGANGQEIVVPPEKVQMGAIGVLPVNRKRVLRVPSDLITGLSGDVRADVRAP